MLCLEWDAHFRALDVSASEVLTRPPCNVALVRGKLPAKPKQVLVPVRGGPHAELALRVGLGLHPEGVTALHLRHPNDPKAGSDAPLKGWNASSSKCRMYGNSSPLRRMRRS